MSAHEIEVVRHQPLSSSPAGGVEPKYRDHKRRRTKPESADYFDLLELYGESLARLGHTRGSIRVEKCLAGEYLVYLEEIGCLDVMEAPTGSVQGFVVSLRKTWRATSLGSALSVFRPFLRFIGREDLIYAAKSIRAPRKRAIIPVLTCEEHEALWDYIGDPALSQRDRSMILLGLLAGLRACDIVSLDLGDIDWRMDTISIVQQKTGNPLVLPLVAMLGNAMAAYIAEERPQSATTRVFLRKRASHAPLSSSAAVYAVIRKAIDSAGIELAGRVCGTRLLRHSAASAMLKSGFPVPTIAAVLGHADPMSADAYLTTDRDGMLECVLPLAGSGVLP
jgi:integrase